MRKCLFYLIFPLFFTVSVANAVIVFGLNVATIPVPNTSASARNAALSKAFGQVLVKLSGNSSVMTVPLIQNALGDMDSFIQSYAYIDQKRLDGEKQLLLQVTFDQNAMKQLLRQNEQADWSSNRPLSLLWIQIPNNGSTMILSSTNDMRFMKAVKKMASLRGIPVLFPTMDLQDQSFINRNTDTFKQTLLKQALNRYGAGAILAGNIQQDGDQWEAKWLLLFNDTPYQWRNKANIMNVLVNHAINNMVNLMASQLAVSDNTALQTDVILDVSNVQNLDDYAKVLQIVRHLSPVSSILIKDMNGSDLLLLVTTVGGQEALTNALSSERHFTILDTPSDSKSAADLFYRWQRE